jgi:hypothetical protein
MNAGKFFEIRVVANPAIDACFRRTVTQLHLVYIQQNARIQNAISVFIDPDRI